jgi:hypothetical protein
MMEAPPKRGIPRTHLAVDPPASSLGHELGQSEGKVSSPALEPQAAERRRRDQQSLGFGRLLPVAAAAAYLGISPWLLRQYIQAGDIPVTRLPRPATASATRGRRPSGDACRLVLLDREDLDQWVDQHCTRERVSVGAFPQRGAA